MVILRVCVVIPCFNHPRTISRVVKDVVERTAYPVLLLDDGSETPVGHTLYSFEVKQAQEQGRVRIARFDRHQGKGAMLRFAIDDLVTQGFTHMLTLDGDGRHLAREIPKLIAEAEAHPWDLVLGNRGLKVGDVGWFKRLTERVMQYSVRYETGSQIKDAQSGFRVYPLFALQTMRFRTVRYDFELEVLIRLLWKGFQVREVPVEIAPFDPDEHHTHFHRFWDSLRLSTLNGVLLGLSLLKTHNRPGELATAIGLGIFVGCTPAFGFHTFMVMALAVVLRLNFVAMWMGTHVSTPILLPFVAMAELHIGQHWLHIKAAEGLWGHVYQITAGSLVLGVLLAVPGALATYLMARSAQKKSSSVEGAAPSLRYRVLTLIARHLGRGPAYAWVRFSSIVRFINRFNVRRGLNEFHRALQPNMGYWARQRLVLRHLRQIGELNADLLVREPPLPREDGVPLKSVERAIVVTGHLGAFALARDVREPARTIERVSGGRYELMPFLGKLAPFDVSAFHLAATSGRPLVASFVLREGRGYVQITRPPRIYAFEPDVPVDEQVYVWAKSFVRHFESHVRRSPTQWLNVYGFFSTAPREDAP